MFCNHVVLPYPTASLPDLPKCQLSHPVQVTWHLQILYGGEASNVFNEEAKKHLIGGTSWPRQQKARNVHFNLFV